MRHVTSRTRLLLIASALVLVSSCDDKLPPPALHPPADLFARSAEPAMTADALTSEETYERQRDAKIEWGRATAGVLDRACRWFRDAGVTVNCAGPSTSAR